MTTLWHSLLLHTGSLEAALALILAVTIPVLFLLAVIGQLAWLVAKRVRPRRELEREARQRRRELEAAVNVTERRPQYYLGKWQQ